MIEAILEDGPAKGNTRTLQSLQDIIAILVPEPISTKSWSADSEEACIAYFNNYTHLYKRFATQYTLDLVPIRAWYRYKSS